MEYLSKLLFFHRNTELLRRFQRVVENNGVSKKLQQMYYDSACEQDTSSLRSYDTLSDGYDGGSDTDTKIFYRECKNKVLIPFTLLFFFVDL